MKKPQKRICVLVRNQEWEPFHGACTSRIHGHMDFDHADGLVDEGLAEWIRIKRITGKGAVKEERAPAIRLIPKRTWRGKVSAGGDGKPMKVMQLLP